MTTTNTTEAIIPAIRPIDIGLLSSLLPSLPEFPWGRPFEESVLVWIVRVRVAGGGMTTVRDRRLSEVLDGVAETLEGLPETVG